MILWCAKIWWGVLHSLLVIFSLQADRGCATGIFFLVGGGGGVWAKKFVKLRGLRISEKKEILRKPTVL
jgi:hypothetical protein